LQKSSPNRAVGADWMRRAGASGRGIAFWKAARSRRKVGLAGKGAGGARRERFARGGGRNTQGRDGQAAWRGRRARGGVVGAVDAAASPVAGGPPALLALNNRLIRLVRTAGGVGVSYCKSMIYMIFRWWRQKAGWFCLAPPAPAAPARPPHRPRSVRPGNSRRRTRAKHARWQSYKAQKANRSWTVVK
jgi:hypothetical protein